jgi:hypothetical protein
MRLFPCRPALLLPLLLSPVVACGPSEVLLGDTQGVSRVVAGVLAVRAATLSAVENGPARETPLSIPVGVALAPDGGFWLSDRLIRRVAHVSLAGELRWVLGGGINCGLPRPGPGTPAGLCLAEPGALALLPDGRLVIADPEGHRVYTFDPTDSTVAVLIGTGAEASGADGAVAASAPVFAPAGLAVGADGSVYIAERRGNRVVRVTPEGQLQVVAGTGVPGDAGDGGPATAAELRFPAGVAIFGDTLYIADTQNHRIRRVVGGQIEALAGLGREGYGGDRRGAGEAVFRRPTHLLAVPGLLFITDSGNDRIRVIRLAADSIDTWAGTGAREPGGDLLEPARTSVSGPQDLSAFGRTILFADSGSFVVRRVIR